MGKTTTSPLLWLPSAADGVQAVPSATAWTYGSYVEITASAPSTLYPAYLAVLPNDGATMTETSVQIQLATGSAGNEVVKATLRVRFDSNQWGPMSTIPLGLLFSSIASSTRVAVRVTHGATSDTDPYRIALGYYSALGGATGWTNQVQTAAPIDNNSVTITGASAWGNGTWAEILSAAQVTEPIYIQGIVTVAWSQVGEVQIGTGSAGSESVIMTLPYNNPNADAGTGVGYMRLPHPVRVAASTRIAMRQRANVADDFFGTIWYTHVS